MGRRDVLLTTAVFSCVPAIVRADRAVSLGRAIVNVVSILVELTKKKSEIEAN